MVLRTTLNVPRFQSASATDFDFFALSDESLSLFQPPLVDPIAMHLRFNMERQLDDSDWLAEFTRVEDDNFA